jgi:hypothetical protein
MESQILFIYTILMMIICLALRRDCIDAISPDILCYDYIETCQSLLPQGKLK